MAKLRPFGWRFALRLALLHALPITALAAAAGAGPAAPLLRLSPHTVPDATLGAVRGGAAFSDAGLQIALTIRRAVQVGAAANGLASAGAGAPSVASGAGQDSPDLTLVQRGSGNAFVAANLGAATAATVVQNTLDNQQIRAVTTIDVQATSLQAYRAVALQATLGNAITASLRR